jgi:hypothetical protein
MLPDLLWETIVDDLVNKLSEIYEAHLIIIFHAVSIWRNIVSI